MDDLGEVLRSVRAPTSERSAAVGGARTRHETSRLVDGSVQSSYSQVVCTFRAASSPVMITGNVLPIVEDVRRGVGQRGRSCIRGPVSANLIRRAWPSECGSNSGQREKEVTRASSVKFSL